jgi:LuxR family transcriptional activator of conjugal transfer of Ti plasmids
VLNCHGPWEGKLRAERLFLEFANAILTARCDDEFERVATRLAHGLGFRWFAYLQLAEGAPKLSSSYPKSWTSRYVRLNYHRIDPVVRRARVERNPFSWGAGGAIRPRGAKQGRLFEEATNFGIRSGITVPIRGGFGQMAAFTLATDDPLKRLDRLLVDTRDMVRLAGFYFHAGLAWPRTGGSDSAECVAALTRRERECLAWVACGKTLSETATLAGVSKRTVAFHLENARRKLDAVSTAHCVAKAMRRGILS